MGTMVTLVDHPLVAEETYRLLLEAFLSSPLNVVIPSHEGRRGHPVVVPQSIMKEILCSPDDSTLRNIMKRHRYLIDIQEVTDINIRTDIDTEEQLKRTGGRVARAKEE
jgi:molybdenum cofactor cytidylyltransferase